MSFWVFSICLTARNIVWHNDIWAADVWSAVPRIATSLSSAGTRCEQVAFIFPASHGLQVAADGSITLVPHLSQNEKPWRGCYAKSVFRSITFAWIDSEHVHQKGEEAQDSVCVQTHTCQSSPLSVEPCRNLPHTDISSVPPQAETMIPIMRLLVTW